MMMMVIMTEHLTFIGPWRSHSTAGPLYESIDDFEMTAIVFVQ